VGNRRSSIQVIDRDIRIATMNTPVAQNMPARALATKNKTKGPISKASFSNGLGADVLLAEFDMANI
jgi:hypothetical protein